MTSHTISANGKVLDLSKPRVMGVLNVTPDSFYDGGEFQRVEAAIKQASLMIDEGADIIDIGGMSSRPGAKLISVDEELSRIRPILVELNRNFPNQFISVDTIRAEVVKQVADLGIDMINDISAGVLDDQMINTVAEKGLAYVIMHMKGRPENMQDAPHYDQLITDILTFLLSRIRICREAGIIDLVIDPGFGFGKTVRDNFRLLKKMHVFQFLDLPILAGLSRKSMIWKTLNIDPSDALNGTTALNMIALQQGARILRVHDVNEAREAIRLFETIQEC